MKLTSKCPYCSKNAEVQREEYLAPLAKYVYTYSCGHTELRSKLVPVDTSFSNVTGDKKAYDFQIEGIKFIEGTNISALNADAMGLGKTIQSSLVIKRNIANLAPCIVVQKSATTFNWVREIKDWVNPDGLSTYPILGSQFPIIPGFQFYIISMDTLARNGTWKKLASLNPKSIIIDECHSFKEDSSNRTRALISLIREAKIKSRILLSGTPIKNRADEYFVALNLIAPEHFYSRAKFRDYWLESPNRPGAKPSRIKPYMLDHFRELTSKWIIRREKRDVLKNLPPFSRRFQTITIDDPNLKESYNRELKLFSNFLLNKANIDARELLGWLAKFRRIIANAKAPIGLEYIKEYLESTEDEKITIGIHHQDVRDFLYYALKKDGYGVLKLSGEDSAIAKDNIVRAFNRPENRVLICNELSGGVGLNLQMCSTVLSLERQWNAADEEQFECRFDRDGQLNPVTVDYMITRGTIEEYFGDMVEEKRKVFGESVTNWQFTSDLGSMRDLADRMVRNPLQ